MADWFSARPQRMIMRMNWRTKQASRTHITVSVMTQVFRRKSRRAHHYSIGNNGLHSDNQNGRVLRRLGARNPRAGGGARKLLQPLAVSRPRFCGLSGSRRRLFLGGSAIRGWSLGSLVLGLLSAILSGFRLLLFPSLLRVNVNRFDPSYESLTVRLDSPVKLAESLFRASVDPTFHHSIRLSALGGNGEPFTDFERPNEGNGLGIVPRGVGPKLGLQFLGGDGLNLQTHELLPCFLCEVCLGIGGVER